MSVNGDTGEVQSNIINDDPTAAYRGTHLDADQALDCGVALAYFIKAFGNLSELDRQVWVEAWSDEHRFELGSLIMSWGAGGDMVFHMALTAADVEVEEIDTTLSTLNDSLTETDFNDHDYANAYDIHLSAPLARLQAAARAEQDNDPMRMLARKLAELMSAADDEDFAA